MVRKTKNSMKRKGEKEMNELQIIEQNGARVLTTAQLAESYGTDVKVISNNYTRNRSRYTAGKHFIQLLGDELKEFKAVHQIDESLKFASSLFLWTEKGAWLHAKSLNTDEAWDAYEMLVDEYYRLANQKKPMTQAELALMHAQNIVALEQRLEVQEKKMDNITDILSLSNNDWRNKVNRIINAIAQKLGGNEYYSEIRAESYQLLEDRAGCLLDTRLNNRKAKMALRGSSKTAINKVSKLDVIEEDKKLISVYITVIKELAVKYQLNIEKYELAKTN